MNQMRCGWVTQDPLYIAYHDNEWGNFNSFFDDRYLFEMLALEGAQAGLSWITILRRRDNYRKAFEHFNLERVANFSEADIERLMEDDGIIRNKLKLNSTVENARAIIKIRKEHGSFHQFLWDFFDGRRTINHWKSDDDVPAKTEESYRLSKELKRQGFSFVGPIICYSFMQAVGLVDDHVEDCFIRKNLKM